MKAKERAKMWNKGNREISAGDHSTNVIAGGNVYLNIGQNISTDIIDQKIEEELETLKKSRFFQEFDTVESSLRLGKRLFEGNLSAGSAESRARALSWCTRLLSSSNNLEQAEEFLMLAKALSDLEETKIAEAFIVSYKGDRATALKILSPIKSNMSISASLLIVEKHGDAIVAQQWFDATGYTPENLDSEGKCYLLTQQLKLSLWDKITQTVGALSNTDFTVTPILHHLAALGILIQTIPQDLRSIVLTQVPFDGREFPLASDASAINARNVAHHHFLLAVEAAEKLALPGAARMDDEYALWLELRDPARSAHGKTRLEQKLRDPDIALGFVHYALNFGIKLDLGAVERDIERNIAINGGMTLDAAIARFALAFTQSTPEKAAEYIGRYHDQLAGYIDATLLRSHQIELLSRGGLSEAANEMFKQFLKEGITQEQEARLRSILSVAKGGNLVDSRKAQYETNKTVGDLINLVSELERHLLWDDLCIYGKVLFDETHSLSDAERLVNGFNNTHRSKEVVTFLKENEDLLTQSDQLRMSYAWGLYHEGALLESRAVLEGIKGQVGRPNYRSLQVNLGIATGDWTTLSNYISNEYQSRNDRTASELIGAAELALNLGLPQAKSLVFEAVERGIDDPTVLTAAYFIATNAGWEDSPKIFEWLEKAAVLSGENGPIQKTNLSDILELKPEWDRRESETWHMLGRGELPIFLAAQSLNRTLVDLTTFPALSNLDQPDPRRKSAIPAYSGKRVPLDFVIGGKTIALDATALLTLSFLNILDVALDAFEIVYIPHSTLAWLFKERQRAAFHQPSRIALAHKVRGFLATDVLIKFNPTTVASSDLSAQVGDDLAALISEAEKVRNADETQHVVIRPAPVHRISTLMDEEADLSAHANVLTGCLAVVEKLRSKGVITTDEEKRARAYLQLRETPWPNQAHIADGATLYLDDLAISYLLHLQLLGKLKAAGLTVVVSAKYLSEANALISYEHISEEVKHVIERIRATLNLRIESGQVKVGRRLSFEETNIHSVSEHPSVGILALAPLCDVSIIDDRFFNQHARIESGGAEALVISTLDLLDTLVAADVLSDGNRLEHRTRLRRAGYVFVPISEHELAKGLTDSTIVKSRVVETAELKAIRESFLRVRMSDWLRLPEETAWLDGTMKAFVNVLKGLWASGTEIEEITARSNWLIKQIDIRGWAHSLIRENADNVIRLNRAAFILLLLAPPTGAEHSMVDAYNNWIEEKLLIPLREQFPTIYEWIVNWYRSSVEQIAETGSLKRN